MKQRRINFQTTVPRKSSIVYLTTFSRMQFRIEFNEIRPDEERIRSMLSARASITGLIIMFRTLCACTLVARVTCVHYTSFPDQFRYPTNSVPFAARKIQPEGGNQKNDTFYYFMRGTWLGARQLSRSCVFHLDNYLGPRRVPPRRIHSPRKVC